MLKNLIRRTAKYTGLEETARIRTAIAAASRPGWPYCPPDEGDLLFRLAQAVGENPNMKNDEQNALEVGFATGSTAAYLLLGLGAGHLTSIDYDQNQYEREGEKLVHSLGFARRHRLIEDNSIRVLPELHASGVRYGLVFLDGWKTFDHMWVDTFYCARMLNRGGFMVFDDARMPAVRKCISLLRGYYQFADVNSYARVGGGKLRLWHALSTRTLRRPYVALQKLVDLDKTEAGRQFDFWKPF
jgi:predicted O-methyltransferase YrrM